MNDIYASLRQSIGLPTNPLSTPQWSSSAKEGSLFVRAVESMTIDANFGSSQIERDIRGNLDQLSVNGGDTIHQNKLDRHLGEAMMSAVVAARRLAMAERMNEESKHDGLPSLPPAYMDGLRDAMKVSLGNMDAHYVSSLIERTRTEAATNKEVSGNKTERVSSDRAEGKSRWARMAELKDRLQFNAAMGMTGVAMAGIAKIGAALAGSYEVGQTLPASGNLVAANAAFSVPEHAVNMPVAGMAAIAAISVAGMGIAAVQAYHKEIGQFMKSMTDKVLGSSVTKAPDVMAGLSARQDKVEVMQSPKDNENRAGNLYTPAQSM